MWVQFFCWFIYFFVLLSKQLKSTFKLFAKWKIKLSNYKHGAKDIRKCMEHEAVGFRNHCATAFPNTLPNTPLREMDNTLPRFKTRNRCLTAKHNFLSQASLEQIFTVDEITAQKRANFQCHHAHTVASGTPSAQPLTTNSSFLLRTRTPVQ